MQLQWTGVETTRALLAADDELQVVISMAHSDYLLEATLRQLVGTDRVMLLKKPFDIAETWLLTTSLADKWRLMHDTNGRLQRQAEQIDNTRRVMSIIEGQADPGTPVVCSVLPLSLIEPEPLLGELSPTPTI